MTCSFRYSSFSLMTVLYNKNTMGRIQQLDTQTANMIAAGEVVERPQGVVKELVENAIDAGSTRITVSIEEGGMKKITVEDNGCGMDATDAEMCFHRHATSKIHNQNDLWSIHTLGFRGEALPSIAAVAKVTLCTSDGNDATKVVIGYGKTESVSPYPCNQGTEISVEGLFYHTPARLKHMKSGSYEATLIQDVMNSFALSHPEIAFHLINDGRDAFRTTGQGNLLEVIFNVFGRAAAENALPVDFSDFDYHVTGYLIKPVMSRASRSCMHIFLNGRMVKTYKLYQSVRQGYEGTMPDNRYPMCVLSVEMDPHLLDVNVHPSKWEVRISKEIQLETLIRNEVKKALHQETAVPEADVHETRTEYYEPLSFDTEDLSPVVEEKKEEYQPQEETPSTFTLDAETREAIAKEAQEDNEFLKQLNQEPEPQPEEEKPDFPPMEVIGQFHQKMILCALDHGIAVISQHAALRRILYEKTLKEMHETVVMLDLIVPVMCHVGDAMVASCDEINQALQDLHIVFEPFGKDTLVVHSIPSWMQGLEEEAFLNDLLDAFRNEHAGHFGKMAEKMAALLACRHGVRRNQKLNMDEMTEVVRQLSQCEDPFHDPSGKPIYIILEEKKLEKELKE